MTELPEHLLKRAAEARARLTGEGGGGGDAAPAATPSVATPVVAASPAVPEEPKAPEPVAPYIEAGLNRKTIPAWIIPVLLFLPMWAIYYVGYLENPPADAGGLLVEGGTYVLCQRHMTQQLFGKDILAVKYVSLCKDLANSRQFNITSVDFSQFQNLKDFGQLEQIINIQMHY